MRTSRIADDTADDLKFSLAAFATVLVSYHSLGYDLSVLALPALLLAGWIEKNLSFDTWARWTIITGLALLLFSPLQMVLLMRYNRLALLAWALLMCFVGTAEELRSGTQRFLGRRAAQP